MQTKKVVVVLEVDHYVDPERVQEGLRRLYTEGQTTMATGLHETKAVHNVQILEQYQVDMVAEAVNHNIEVTEDQMKDAEGQDWDALRQAQIDWTLVADKLKQ